MTSRWWPSFAVCAFVLAVLAMAANFDRETTSAAPALPLAPLSTAATSFPAATSSPAAPAATEASASYVGNTNTHKFHRNTCRYAGCPNCTARFATREEAIAAGYRPCGICDP